VPGEVFHHFQVRSYGSLREITPLELFQHHCSELAHRDLLVNHSYASLPDASSCAHSQRPPGGAFVLTAKWRVGDMNNFPAFPIAPRASQPCYDPYLRDVSI
jgi:hypothetical protein